MAKIKKIEYTNPKSHYESQWSMSDYVSHEVEFKKMEKEVDELLKRMSGNALMTRWTWLEKQGAVKIERAENDVCEFLVRQSYAMESAKYDRFTEWRSFNFKRDNKWVEKLETIKKDIKNKMTVKLDIKNEDTEIDSLEKVADQTIYNENENIYE